LSEHPVADFAERIRTYLDGDDPDAALIALIVEPEALTGLLRCEDRYYGREAQPLIGLATALMAPPRETSSALRAIP
jgi:hypothetical protein